MSTEQVHIRIDVNVNGMRRGDELAVRLTPFYEGLIFAGYATILGHVEQTPTPPALQGVVADPPATPPRRGVTTGGDSAGASDA